MYILSLSTGVKFGLETVQSARSSRLLCALGDSVKAVS